jgi:hypothetical protein
VFGALIGITAALPCLILVSFVLMVVLGAVTIYLARADIKSSGEALIASGLAGGISGITGGITATVWLMIIVFLARYYDSRPFSGQDISGLGIYGMICLPILVVSGVLLAAIGGYVYYAIFAKKG